MLVNWSIGKSFWYILPNYSPVYPFVILQHGVTPIIWAAGRGHSGVVAALLSNGAKVNSADKVCLSICLCVTFSNQDR